MSPLEPFALLRGAKVRNLSLTLQIFFSVFFSEASRTVRPFAGCKGKKYLSKSASLFSVFFFGHFPGASGPFVRLRAAKVRNLSLTLQHFFQDFFRGGAAFKRRAGCVTSLPPVPFLPNRDAKVAKESGIPSPRRQSKTGKHLNRWK